MVLTRVIPCLLLSGAGLVKTTRFEKPVYLGDPRVTIKIFNEKEVDELLLVDIEAPRRRREPDFDLLAELTSECFMPLAYGGGLRRMEQIERVLKAGVEKAVLNTAAVEDPELVSMAARTFGSQSVVVSIDVRKTWSGRYEVCTSGGQRKTGLDPADLARRMEDAGAGEIVLTSIDRDGTMSGYDLELVRRVSSAVRLPVVACGGAGSVADLGRVVREGGASAAAAGSLFVFHGRHRAVLINFPTRQDIDAVLA